MNDLLQNIFSGIAIGSVYGLVAIGYSLFYRSMGVVNFAHGSVIMAGVYLGVTFYHFLHLPYFVGLIVAVALSGLIGVALERVLRPIFIIDPIYMLLGTLGVSIILDNIIMLIWGTEGQFMEPPFGLNPLRLGGIVVSKQDTLILIVGLILVYFLRTFLKKSKIGKAMRALAYDQEIARTLGVPVNKLNALTFSIGSGIAGLAGFLVVPNIYIEISFGWYLGLKGFAAAVIGGFGSLYGAMLGGLLIGVFENIASYYISSTYKYPMVFILMLIILVIKPSGFVED